MRKNSGKLMAFLSLLFAVTDLIAAIGDGTPWFVETTQSYVENVENRWHTELGAAEVEDGRIKMASASSTAPVDKGVTYTPTASAPSGELLLSEMDVSFADVGDEALEAGASFVGIQVLQNPAVEEKSGVFAVLEPTKGTAVWRKTAVPAQFGKRYFLRIEVDATSSIEYARYLYRESEASGWSEIALVKLPAGMGKLTKALWSGEGSLAKIEATVKAGGGEAFARYLRWAYADAILTWKGGSTSKTCREFVYGNGSWGDGVATYADDAARAKMPTSVLRFAGSVAPMKMDIAFDSLAGVVVEDGATGYSIELTKESRLGSATDFSTTRFEFNEDFKLGNGYQVSFVGDVELFLKAAKTLDASAASSVRLDASSYAHLRLQGGGKLKLPASGLDATGSTVVDLSGLTASPASVILGKIRVDAGTAFVLPAGSQAGTPVTLCRDAIEVVSGGASGTRLITVDGVSYAAEVTISGNQLTFLKRGYSKWGAKPAVFTWMGATTAAADGYYQLFSTVDGRDTEIGYAAGERYRNVPGWGVSPVPDFSWVFHTEAEDEQALPFAKPAGYVLRFAGSQAFPTAVRLGPCRNRFGGLVVEGGTRQPGFVSADAGDVEIGDSSSTLTNYVDVGANFTVDGNQLEILGRTEVNVEAGVALDVDGRNAIASAAPNPDVFPELRLKGDGVINCNELHLEGPSTLDMSGLSVVRADPYVRGDLQIGELCRIVFPASLAADAAYPLCTGSLSASDGIRAVALGDGEFFLANVSFDVDAKTVKYGSASTTVQKRTVSTDCTWSSLSLTAGRSVTLELTRDVRILVNASFPSIPALLVTGGHKLSLVMRNNLDIGAAFLGRESRFEVVYDNQCADFGKELEVRAGLPYATVIEVSGSVIWSMPVSVFGRLIVRGGLELQDVNGAIGRGAVVEVASGASLKLSGAQFRCVGARFVINGELALTGGGMQVSGGTRFEFGNNGRISGIGALMVDGPVAMMVAQNSAATISAPLECSSSIALTAESGSVISFQSEDNHFGEGAAIHPYGDGKISIANISQLSFTGDTFVQGGLVGGGEAIFSGNPKDTGVENSLRASSLWTGKCHFRGVDFSALDPSDFGNFNSTLTFEGCTGVFDENADYDGPAIGLESTSETYPVSLTIPDGHDASTIVLSRLFGDGKLKVGAVSGARSFRVSIPGENEYTGSLVVDGAVNHNSIVIGSGSDVVGDGKIAVLSGVANIGTNAEWTANGGIFVAEQGLVCDCGRIGSEVSGSGTVVYTNLVNGADYPEVVAGFDNQGTWSGQVMFDGAKLMAVDPQVMGNAGSRVVFRNSNGTIKAGTIPGETEMKEGGLKVLGAASSDEVRFNMLTGSGDFTIDCAGAAYYRIPSVENFKGSIAISNGVDTAVLVIGEDEKLNDRPGSLQVSNGTVLDKDLKWTVPRVVFGDGKLADVTVKGAEGDDLLSVTGNDVDFSYVRVTLVGSVGRIYGLAYDGDRQRVYITARATPPSFDSDISVTYGLDFTNATVRLTVSDFNKGYQYGSARAEVFVYDAFGNICGYGSILVNGDGTFLIPGIDLPSGQGGDYRYDVVISAEAEASGESAEIDSVSYYKPGVHFSGDWFHETAETFASDDPQQKTGDWSVPSEESAIVTNGVISITTTGDPVAFAPFVQESNDVVKVETRAVFHAVCDLASFRSRTREAGALTAFSLVALNANTDNERLAFAVYSHAADDTMAVFGKFEPELETEYVVCQTINHRTGFVSYEVNGAALTNVHGVSSFALAEGSKSRQVRDVAFTGVGAVAELSGTQLNGRLAGVEIDGVTNEFYSVDDAVAAAISNGVADVNLLWDATWTPLTNDVGRTVAFDMNGHVLYIDPSVTNAFVSQGYQVHDNHDGSYTIGVVDYFLTFIPNSGKGDMSPQRYSVTNMVFNIASNQFVSATGTDFAFWNQMADGSGPTNWEDGAVIDMTAFGLTNMNMFAHWKIAVRYVTIESADEFVYVDMVLTNSAVNSGVRFLREADDAKAAKGIGKAQIPIESGTKTLEIKFSTDIERALSYVATNWTSFTAPFTVEHEYLPVILNGIGSDPVTDLLHLWAAAKGIPETKLGSPYALVSCALDLSHVITESSEVRISDFATEPDGCSFRVEIDDEPVKKLDRVLPMVRMSTDLSSEDNWRTPIDGDISVDDSGRVKVKSVSGAFIKLVVH